jgi:outer membrane protein TolC
VGNGAKTDMLQAKIDLNAQEVNLQNIYKQVSNTKASMNTLLKKDAGASFHPKEEQFSIPSIEYNSLVSKIDQQNPQLLLAQQEKLNLMIEKKIISSQRMPSVNLNSNTVLNRSKSTAGFFLTNQTFGPNIGLGIGIPIFNGNINKTQLKVNSIQQKKQDLQTEQLRALLQRDLLIAFQEYQNAVSVSMVEESNVQLAKENNLISTERFKKLQSNSIELRQAQLSLIEAQDRYINAQYRAQIAATAIRYITGEISKQ